MKNHIKFSFYKCRKLDKKDSIANVLKTITTHGIVLATYDKLSKKPFVTSYTGSVEEYVDEKYRKVELVDGDEIPLDRRSGPFRLSATGLIKLGEKDREDQSVSIGFDTFGEKFNKVSGTLIAREEKIETLFELLIEIGKAMYPVLQPAFGYVGYSGEAPGTIFDDVYSYKLKKIYPVTFFGPDYVSKYGKDYLLKAPVWKTELLPDGGVFLQVREYFTKPLNVAALSQIKKCFSEIGIKSVSWS